MTEAELRELQAVERVAQVREAIFGELRKVIVGQTQVIEQLLIALLAKGHCLLIGVPGLAKTLLVSTLARVLDLSFKRIQFTPDLMPSDILGTDVLQEDPETGRRRFEFMPGPIFANIILADEINRAPPKTQSALLEAMQERRVTVGGRTYELPQPFSSWLRKTLSRWKALTRSQKRNLTDFCSASCSITHPRAKRKPSST
jgi:MoxR-like ATPase